MGCIIGLDVQNVQDCLPLCLSDRGLVARYHSLEESKDQKHHQHSLRSDCSNVVSSRAAVYTSVMPYPLRYRILGTPYEDHPRILPALGMRLFVNMLHLRCTAGAFANSAMVTLSAPAMSTGYE